jgi:predicted RNA binding protein YcfA (HicA-like mRNA interferase family)
MSKNRNLKPKGNSSDDYLAYMRGHGNYGSERQSGSHVVVTSTKGNHVTVPHPRREFPIGTERSIRKQMIAAGFLLLAIALLIGVGMRILA